MDESRACDAIKDQIRQVSEEVCTILSSIPLLISIDEGKEMEKRIERLDGRIQSLLGPLHYYTSAPAPATVDRDLWEFERKEVNRKFESTIENFRSAQKMFRLHILKLNAK